jgi:regulatory protein
MRRGKKYSEQEPLTPDEILSRMERFCAWQERAPAEVYKKLNELGAAGETAGMILGILRDDGYFDEQRFASTYARGKLRMNNWGKIKIRLALRAKGISPEVISQALSNLDETEYLEILGAVIRKKKASCKDSADSRHKTVEAALRMGFEPELVFSEVKNQFA